MVDDTPPNKPLEKVNQTILEVLTPTQELEQEQQEQLTRNIATILQVQEELLKEMKLVKLHLSLISNENL